VSGQIVQLSISAGGLPKHPTPIVFAGRLGLHGDRHSHPKIHGGPRKAILLIAAEVLDELTARGYPVFPGAMGENVTTRGLDIRILRIGDFLRAGRAVLEITQPRGPCKALDIFGTSIKAEIYDEQVRCKDASSPRWGMSGLYAAVVKEGELRTGDAINRIG
jgi:MOSC domain-containing protein YiiM